VREEVFNGELTQSQIVDMLRVSFTDERWPNSLRRSPEIEDAYRRWLMTECEHDEEPQIRKKTTKNGSIQFVKVCIYCGHQFGTPIPHKNIDNPEDVTAIGELSAHDYENRRREDWRDQKIAFYEKQHVKISNEYEAYLKSDEWNARREKVFLRADGICEGCGVAKATQVHHLSYENRYNEFLWELVAICNDCHVRAHPEKNGKFNGDD
jgi:hypothetical protein